jgi:hypothetical protein
VAPASPGQHLLNEARSSADQALKIKRHQKLRQRALRSGITAQPPADIPQELKPDIRIGVVTKIDIPEVEWARRNEIGAAMQRIVAHKPGCGGNLLVLARIRGISRRCDDECGAQAGRKDFEWQR